MKQTQASTARMKKSEPGTWRHMVQPIPRRQKKRYRRRDPSSLVSNRLAYLAYQTHPSPTRDPNALTRAMETGTAPTGARWFLSTANNILQSKAMMILSRERQRDKSIRKTTRSVDTRYDRKSPAKPPRSCPQREKTTSWDQVQPFLAKRTPVFFCEISPMFRKKKQKTTYE